MVYAKGVCMLRGVSANGSTHTHTLTLSPTHTQRIEIYLLFTLLNVSQQPASQPPWPGRRRPGLSSTPNVPVDWQPDFEAPSRVAYDPCRIIMRIKLFQSIALGVFGV